eukprot:GHRR01007702.1.p1 GENE.GHRR01007702.1~~GHRR01007702.1.p1  ORF type:complete len:901 (+),score=370.22 GHRR01007702.1:192-2894(+)
MAENGKANGSVDYDSQLYNGGDRFAGYNTSIAIDEDDEDEPTMAPSAAQLHQLKYGAPDPDGDAEEEPSGFTKPKRIVDREDDYKKRRLGRMLSPDRNDAFIMGDKTPDARVRTYADVMREQLLQREQANTIQNIIDKQKAGVEAAVPAAATKSEAAAVGQKRRNRWDQSADDSKRPKPDAGSDWDSVEATPAAVNRWDATPGAALGGATPAPNTWDATPGAAMEGATPGPNAWDATPGAAAPAGGSRWDATPGAGVGATPGARRNRWDETPAVDPGVGATPAAEKKRSRWDETPAPGMAGTSFGATPAAALGGQFGATPAFTPMGAAGLETPAGPGMVGMPGGMTPDQWHADKAAREMYERNKPLSDEELDALLPGPEQGYKVLPPPAGYQPIFTPARKLMATPTPGMFGGVPGTPMYSMPVESDGLKQVYGGAEMPEGLPELKPEDAAIFGKLLEQVDEAELSAEEAKERKIMKLLLKVKNGTPPQRKSALRQLTEKARDFGAKALFDQILPLLMTPTLEDQERHLLVKVIDRILYKLDELVRPYVHKILVVIEPLLIDEDYYARVEGREIIANLSKAAGLAQMIAAMRPDIDNIDEYVRNTTARAFSVVASALGIPALLPFLKAVCLSKKSWQARHTGIKIVQQIAILMGCAVLPHLKALVDIIKHGLKDENQKVKTITALCLAALAEAASPYGIESFDDVLEPLWRGIRSLRGKVLAAFLKCIGFIIPLMDAEHAFYYTREVMVVLKREFQTPDEEMKKIVLKVVQQCVATEGVEPEYIITEVLPEFFRCFWQRRMALDRRNYRALVETTVALANKAGCSIIVSHIVEDLKDEAEPYRRMVMETIDKVITNLGAADIDARLEELLVDGILYAFQEQVGDVIQVQAECNMGKLCSQL